MAAYKISTGRNTMGTWAAHLCIDHEDWNEKRLARAGYSRPHIGVIDGYGIDEAAAVADAVTKANAAEKKAREDNQREALNGC